jgi:hypothetical protein
LHEIFNIASLNQYLPSLQDYVLVSQDRIRLEHFHKLAHNEWRYLALNKAEDILYLDAVGVQLPLKEIYLDAEPNLS